MADLNYNDGSSSNSVPRNIVQVVPGTPLDTSVRCIMVDVVSDVFVDTVGGQLNVRLPNLAPGMWHPVHLRRVVSASAATYIAGGY